MNKIIMVGLVFSFVYLPLSAQTIQLAVTKHPISQESISHTPGYVGAGLGTGAVLYCSSWGASLLGSHHSYLHNGMIKIWDFLENKVLAENVLGYRPEDAGRNGNTVYRAFDRGIYYLLFHPLQLYAMYKAGSVTRQLTHTFVNRNRWTTQLIAAVQEEIKIVALLRSAKQELTQLTEAAPNKDIAAMIVTSGVQTIDQTIQNYLKMISTTLKKINEHIDSYQQTTHRKLFTDEVRLAFEAINQDFVALVYGGTLKTEDMLMICQDDTVLSKMLNQLYEAKSLVEHKDDSSEWSGARKIREATRSLFERAEHIMQTQETIIADAFKHCNRMLWWRSLIEKAPVVRQLV